MKNYRYLLDPNKIGKIRLGESIDLCSSSTRSCFGCRNILVIANLYSLYIYTPKPGRSPTRQYSVLSCFFPSRPASDFFLDFKKHFLLVVPANQVHQAEKHLKG